LELHLCILVYAVCIPGVFAVTLNIYLFLFERQSVWQANIILQFLPVISMGITLMLIKSKIPFSLIPGFGKISGFLTLIAAIDRSDVVLRQNPLSSIHLRSI
jgi:hypothetical protein